MPVPFLVPFQLTPSFLKTSSSISRTTTPYFSIPTDGVAGEVLDRNSIGGRMRRSHDVTLALRVVVVRSQRCVTALLGSVSF
jgi:hypothetical protein